MVYVIVLLPVQKRRVDNFQFCFSQLDWTLHKSLMAKPFQINKGIMHASGGNIKTISPRPSNVVGVSNNELIFLFSCARTEVRSSDILVCHECDAQRA